jgi:glycosyltransferase involved in cell wall biosynthesis
MTSIRIVHDGSFIHPGGAGRVAKKLAEVFDAPVTVGHSVAPEFWDDVKDVEFVFQDSFHKGLSGKGWNAVPKPYAEFRVGQRYGSLSFDEEIILSTSIYSKWFVPEYDQYHIHYANAHPVYFYPRVGSGLVGWLKRFAKSTIDQHYVTYCDYMIANSKLTQQRINKYYRRDPPILPPPIRFDRFTHREPDADPYFVMIGRLVESKRVDTVAEAFANIDEAELHLVGSGPLREYCASIDGVTVHTGLSDSEVEELVSRCVGGIAFAEWEHCGMTPKEFQAAGKPVIVPDEPNLCNHVDDGVTGVVVPISHDGVKEGVRNVMGQAWNADTIQTVAKEWSEPVFAERARQIVDSVVTSE